MSKAAAAKSKACRECGQDNPLSNFGKQSHAPDGLMQVCNACRKARRDAKRAAGEMPDESAIETGDDAGPSISRGPSLGFTAQLQDGDVVLEQETAAGKVAIWLSRGEATEFATWVIAGCGLVP